MRASRCNESVASIASDGQVHHCPSCEIVSAAEPEKDALRTLAMALTEALAPLQPTPTRLS